MHLVLPTLKKYSEKVVFESPGYSAVPLSISPVSSVDEKNVVEMLAEALNKDFMTDLALELNTCRETDGVSGEMENSTLEGKRFITVGASHAACIACALEDMGAHVVDISVPGWRISAENVELMIRDLKSVLEEDYNGETLIIYHLFDNSTYLSCLADGTKQLPVKLGDGKYHIPGRVVYVDRTGFRELFTLVLPLLRAGMDHTKLLLTPIIRYALEPCCGNPAHVTNKKEANYGAALGEALSSIAEWLQDFAFTRWIRNFAVVNTTVLVQAGSTPVNFWTEGPVHMNVHGYAALAAALVDHAGVVNLSRKTDKSKMSTGGRPLVDKAALRKSCVSQNDSAVQRKDDREMGGHRGGRGAGRGRPFPRGRGGYRGHHHRGPSKKHFRMKPY
jgi:hypothetical protein